MLKAEKRHTAKCVAVAGKKRPACGGILLRCNRSESNGDTPAREMGLVFRDHLTHTGKSKGGA